MADFRSSDGTESSRLWSITAPLTKRPGMRQQAIPSWRSASNITSIGRCSVSRGDAMAIYDRIYVVADEHGRTAIRTEGPSEIASWYFPEEEEKSKQLREALRRD